ncbi:MAG TPA: flagellar export protein FliJ [Methylomusa anaerophila]|uniref:Flagellar FliJ protein n=1 Tax=Methylomusa anaerophila TaxID=1930071 RepID=A0A348AQ37_9FIRM|nr:flagellar export protein FliJ [Methylomusa anaerophila]BBB93185.1 flagellar FliJ protein [Methylomusa anaerophila]HML86983.1 flagellar export protein FliJ [Methylomusa anaerophila]
MKIFQFRLETLLRFRRIQEEKAQIKLAEASNRLNAEQELLNNLEASMLRVMKLQTTQQLSYPKIEILQMTDNFINKVKQDLVVQTEKVNQATSCRQDCLQVLEDAMKKRKIVDNLRNKRLEQYREELLHEEQKYLDEIGTQISVRDKESVI